MWRNNLRTKVKAVLELGLEKHAGYDKRADMRCPGDCAPRPGEIVFFYTLLQRANGVSSSVIVHFGAEYCVVIENVEFDGLAAAHGYVLGAKCEPLVVL